jgi:LruC domain-containing protein
MKTAHLFFASMALFVASCASDAIIENPTGTVDSMDDLQIPEGFDFAMTEQSYLEFDGLNRADLAAVEVFRNRPTTASIPLWKIVGDVTKAIEQPVLELRSTDNKVYVRVTNIYGSSRILETKVVAGQIALNLHSIVFPSSSSAMKTGSCTDSLSNGGGFGTNIVSVVDSSGSWIITVKVEHDGCSGPSCKALSHFSVEAAAGTFSHLKWATNDNISGQLSNSLGNNDPFDGFKLDNTSGIGNGNAGSFTLTYTLTELQDQQFLAKAGNDYSQIAAFDSADFYCVYASALPPQSPDSDNDGINDDVDDFPNDPSLATLTISDTNSFVAEDKWPFVGDFDFNDLVVSYFTKSFIDPSNDLVEIRFIYKFRARGAGYQNGFGFLLDTDPSNATVTGFVHTEGYVTVGANGAESGVTDQLSVVAQDLVNNKLWRGNTKDGEYFEEDTWDTVTIAFTTPVATSVAGSLNPYLICQKVRGMELHEVGHEPSSLADGAYYGTWDDDTNPAAGIYFQQSNGLPWVLNIPGEFEYPYEYQDITGAYLNFSTWAQSGGALNTDWYNTALPANIDQSKIYAH